MKRKSNKKTVFVINDLKHFFVFSCFSISQRFCRKNCINLYFLSSCSISKNDFLEMKNTGYLQIGSFKFKYIKQCK